MALSKSQLQTFDTGVSGQVTEAKLAVMQVKWLKFLEATVDSLSGITEKVGIDLKEEGGTDEVLICVIVVAVGIFVVLPYVVMQVPYVR